MKLITFIRPLSLSLVLWAGTAMAQEVCNDTQDNDKDGLVDCADPDCAADPFCKTPPPPPPKVTAECSPGYFKNHPGEWCGGYVGTGPNDPSFPASNLSKECATGDACTLLLQQLSAQGPTGEAIRRGAQSFLNACFVTAEASPCDD